MSAVKKVKAYPFDAVITQESRAMPVRIVKLTTVGLMCDMAGHLISVCSKCNISFQIPVLKLPVQASLVVVRTWDQFAVNMGTGNASHKLAELHFQGISADHRENIVEFLRSIHSPDAA